MVERVVVLFFELARWNRWLNWSANGLKSGRGLGSGTDVLRVVYLRSHRSRKRPQMNQ